MTHTSHTRKITWCGTPGPLTFEFGEEFEENETPWLPLVRALGIVLTNYCPLACAHCYNKSGPKGGEYLKLTDLQTFSEFLVSQDHPLKAVGLSGGEAVYHPEFLAIASYFSGQNMRVSCNTGGHGVTGKLLHDMKDAGIDEVVFSSDPYHEQQVGQSYLFPLVATASELLQTVVKISVADLAEGKRRVTKLNQILPESVRVVVQPVLRIGRAAQSGAQKKLFRDVWYPDSYRSDCAHEMGALGINYDGRVYACCSVGSFTPGLEVASVTEPDSFIHMSQRYTSNAKAAFLGNHDTSCDHKCESCHVRMQKLEAVAA